ncbi:AAA family ATPase [Priestia megaterium]|uniref:AAA family ATPase n=1 Tax=Priestia megaterium TaxID=1404 RepID=UPI000BFEA5E9|nr:AAA family ATPase [Priestia megaterium]PGR79738.1 hypothetical protein COC53_26450 [Priestia megaterium]
MSNFGFYIQKLMLTGANVEDTYIKFSKGLNIISGPSDTGKSYIFESINYILGSSTKPKTIDESKGYSSILLEIVLYSGETHTLKRNFNKNIIEVYDGPINNFEQFPSRTLQVKHDKENTENLSAFLLDKSGFNHPSYILTNKKESKVRTLSFRDLPIYINVSEDKIIKKESPIFSGQYTAATVEKAVFKLVVSGIDDSDKKPFEEENTISFKSKFEGQKELLERLINIEEKELLGLSPDEISTINILDIDGKMEEIRDKLEIINLEIKTQTNERRNLWNRIEEDKSRRIAVSEFIKRFNLLREQYESDLERLNFIREGNYYFSQLNFSFCPFCNQKLEQSRCGIEKCGFNTVENSKLTEATEAEINKINLHLIDLKSTIEENVVEYEELASKIQESETKYLEINNKLNQILEPKETNLKALLDSYVIDRDNTIKYKLRLDKIEELNKEKKVIEGKLKKQPKAKSNEEDKDNGIILNAYEDFCKYMEETLKRWHFSLNTIVTFDKDTGFFFVNSKSTQNYGKGYRAIIYSAFALSLIEYCKDKDLPHPGFVVLDSPLTMYKGKKKKNTEDVNFDIQSAFFNDLTSLHEDMQVIVLENKEPDDDVKVKINYIEFTMDENEGRYGFFPKR